VPSVETTDPVVISAVVMLVMTSSCLFGARAEPRS
jgi:hypothetical protein